MSPTRLNIQLVILDLRLAPVSGGVAGGGAGRWPLTPGPQSQSLVGLSPGTISDHFLSGGEKTFCDYLIVMIKCFFCRQVYWNYKNELGILRFFFSDRSVP